MSSTKRASFSVCAASSLARCEGMIIARLTARPSDLETIFCAKTRISLSSRATLFSQSALRTISARLSPWRMRGMPDKGVRVRGMIENDLEEYLQFTSNSCDLNARVGRTVLFVDVDQYTGQPLNHNRV